ncbi:hypothetical protein [Phytohabitans rumicis]|uniref:Uncharacterized protein n=1 Tax=Phytohabitans rumicis TaxID=1076125 RepID=A0A6V8L4U2_9ACTN|nr:hypothetical protein [Phytohabitans rumicis]GFJ92283.1 hypothetical protein Prum_059250 [Phytohabitans rumicis]
MIDEVEVRRDLAQAAQALDQAVAFLASYDAAQAALLGMAPGWDSPLTTAVRDGRLAVERVAAYVRALTGEAPAGEPVNGARLNGSAVRPLVLMSHGDPGE